MNYNVQQLLEQGGLSKMEHMETVLKGVQEFYQEELKKTKENLEVIKNVIEQAPHLTNNKESD
jgi:hypothetical protein